MKIIDIKTPNDIVINEDIAVAIGGFDGIHLGHQALLNKLSNSSYKKAVLTFNPTPKSFFSNLEIKYLTPLMDKLTFFKDFDYVLIINFNNSFKNMSKDEFIKLLNINHVKEVICGFDFTFGKNKEGKALDLSTFKLSIISKLEINNEKISSSNIRRYLDNGNILKANQFLGRFYKIKGKVIDGSHLGRTIGFPTANIEQNDYYLPKNGVYVTLTSYKNRIYRSMTNIGNNPTFNYQNNKRIETYLLDLDMNLYNEEITIYFIDKIRDEIKFNSKNELILELTKNKEYVRNYNYENTNLLL